jgi:hypothetical protein
VRGVACFKGNRHEVATHQAMEMAAQNPVRRRAPAVGNRLKRAHRSAGEDWRASGGVRVREKRRHGPVTLNDEAGGRGLERKWRGPKHVHAKEGENGGAPGGSAPAAVRARWRRASVGRRVPCGAKQRKWER